MCSACLFSFFVFFDLSPRGIVSSLVDPYDVVQMVYRQATNSTEEWQPSASGGIFFPHEFTIRAPHACASASIPTLLPADRAVDHRGPLHRPHGYSVAGWLFHGLALVRGDRFSDGVRNLADLANRAVFPGRCFRLRLLLRQRANRPRSRNRFPRPVREPRRWRDGRCLTDV